MQAAHDRQVAVALEPHQQIRLGGGDRVDQFAVVEVAVQQHQHPGVQAGDQPVAHGRLPGGGGPKAASMRLRVPHATRATRRSSG